MLGLSKMDRRRGQGQMTLKILRPMISNCGKTTVTTSSIMPSEHVADRWRKSPESMKVQICLVEHNPVYV